MIIKESGSLHDHEKRSGTKMTALGATPRDGGASNIQHFLVP